MKNPVTENKPKNVLVSDAVKIIRHLDSKRRRLESILAPGKNYNSDSKYASAHERRQANARAFLEELRDISLLDIGDLNVQLVTEETLQKQAEKADFAIVDYDGRFCKLILIKNYPYDDLWLLYVAPVDSISKRAEF